jgi:ATP-dependent exoDNAse (exonuclease V) beta subunit
MEEKNIENMQVENYHSFAQQNFGMEGYKDIDIFKLLETLYDELHTREILDYDILILDEVQDLRLHYYQIVIALLSMTKPSIRLCVLGDVYQNIYSYDRSDPRYLTMANQIYNYHPNSSPFDWIELPLSVTFRVTQPICDFVNRHLGIPNYINSTKPGPKPQYYYLNKFDNLNPENRFNEQKNDIGYIVNILSKILNNGNKADDIFILARRLNIKSKQNPLHQLINKLKEKNIPIYKSNKEDENPDENEMKDKLCIISMHQSKGLERKIIILWDFDTYGYSDDDKNLYYVGLTRSFEQLILIHHSTQNIIPTLTLNDIKTMTELKEKNSGIMFKEKKDNPTKLKTISPTYLLEHLNSNLEYELSKLLEWKIIQSPSTHLDIPINVKSKVSGGSIENVSAYNGIILPQYYEYIRTKNFVSIIETIRMMSINHTDDNKNIIIDRDGNINKYIMSQKIRELLSLFKNNINTSESIAIQYLTEAIVLYNALKDNVIHKYQQIKQFDWIKVENLKLAYKRLNNIINKYGKIDSFKTEVEHKLKFDYNNYFQKKMVTEMQLLGYIDCITRNKDEIILWEFKTTKEITEIHKLQLALYAYLYHKLNKNQNINIRYLLYNILTDELLELVIPDPSTLEDIYQTLMKSKAKASNGSEIITDDEFKEKCLSLIAETKKARETKNINQPTTNKNNKLKENENIGMFELLEF